MRKPLVAAKPLEYKEDWPLACERFLAFWEHEIIDRVCLSVRAPREEQVPIPESPDPEVEIADIDFWLSRLNAHFAGTYYGGEAIPQCGSIVGYAVFGGEPQFRKVEGSLINTIWIDPFIETWEGYEYRFDPQNRMCQLMLELKQREYVDSRGKYLPALEGVLWPTEMLALFRGYNNLCLDLFEHPDEVRDVQQELLRGYKWINGERFKIIHSEEEGGSSVGLWAPGRFLTLGCDFSCLISAGHYREFVQPEIREFAEWTDYSLYHLDGPEAAHHLPALFEIEALDCIQFTIGAGHWHEHSTHWLPLYRRMQDAGKLIQISARYDEVEPLLDHLDPHGIFITTSAPSVEAATDLLRRAERWTCRGIHPV